MKKCVEFKVRRVFENKSGILFVRKCCIDDTLVHVVHKTRKNTQHCFDTLDYYYPCLNGTCLNKRGKIKTFNTNALLSERGREREREMQMVTNTGVKIISRKKKTCKKK